MTTNTKVTSLFLVALIVYLIKVPLGIILYFNESYTGVFYVLVLSTSIEVAIFTYINNRR